MSPICIATKTRNHEGFTKTIFKFLIYFAHLCVIVTSWQKNLENFFEYIFSHILSIGDFLVTQLK